MDKFIKIQSNQSEFSSSANLCDFVIPQGEVYDLRDSFVNFVVNIDVTETETASGIGVYDMDLEWVTTDTEKPKFFNSALVRDCRMETANQGVVESIRRVDILSQARQTYEKSWGDAKAESYMIADQVIDPINLQQYGIYRQFNKEGVNKSIVNNNVPVMVRLGDLMDVCNTPEYDTRKTGQSRIHFRLNLDKIQPVQRMLNANIAPAAVKTFQKITTEGAANAITLGKDDGSAITQIRNLAEVPYYVGMKCLLSATHTDGGGSNVADAPVVISSIVWNQQNTVQGQGGSYTLTFENSWGTLTAGKEYTAITLKPQAPIASATAKLVLAQLVLKKLENPQGLDRIDYHTFTTEQGFGNNQQNFNDVFVIEPESDNMIMTFQDGADNLVSKNSQLQSYQISVDNVPQTNRLVSKNSPLDFDRKFTTFTRLGVGLHNLTENAGNSAGQSWGNLYQDAKFESTIVASPLPTSDRSKQLAVNINGSAGGVGAYAIFKSIPRQLVL
tara:strand:- start:1319 stop:2821 length:1503 start_codon:yes stop_codon:yes gene_type:complete